VRPRNLLLEPSVTIKESPDFKKEQIEYLRKLIANSPISVFSRPVTKMCSEETRKYAYDNICALEDEMINRGIIIYDNINENEEVDSIRDIRYRFPLKKY